MPSSPNHQITSPASLAELAYSARAAARATQHLTQLGAPYSECEGSLTVSEDHGQTIVLLVVNSSAHVSCRHYLKTSAQTVCVLFTETPTPRPRPRPQQPALSPSITCAERSIDELRATQSLRSHHSKMGAFTDVAKVRKQQQPLPNIHQQALTENPPSDPLRPSPRSRLPLRLPRLRPPPAHPQTPRPLQPIPAP